MSRTLIVSGAVHALAVLALVLAGTTLLISAQEPAPRPAPVVRVVTADQARLSVQIRLLEQNVASLDSMPLTLPPAL